jgi:hypothetical protein
MIQLFRIPKPWRPFRRFDRPGQKRLKKALLGFSS